MDSISLAGVPIIAEVGNSGGYFIAPDYKISNYFVDKADFALIIMALKSLSTSYDSSRLDSILDKYLSLKEKSAPPIFLDYGAAKENKNVVQNNQIIEENIIRSVQIEFDYCNAAGAISHKIVCPLALRFKWYAWYLFAVDTANNDYRTYKVARAINMRSNNTAFTNSGGVEELLLASEKQYLQTCEDIEVWCAGKHIAVLEEYFPEEKKEKQRDNNYIMHLHVPPGERLWKALLLSMGDNVKILSPDYYKDELIKTAEKYLLNYDIHMS